MEYINLWIFTSLIWQPMSKCANFTLSNILNLSEIHLQQHINKLDLIKFPLKNLILDKMIALFFQVFTILLRYHEGLQLTQQLCSIINKRIFELIGQVY